MVVPRMRMLAPRSSPSASTRLPYQGGTYSLDERIDVPDVDELRAPVVGGCRDRAHEVVVLELARDADDLARLDVRADRDGEVGQPLEVGVPHEAKLTRQGDGFAARYQPIDACSGAGAAAAARSRASPSQAARSR